MLMNNIWFIAVGSALLGALVGAVVALWVRRRHWGYLSSPARYDSEPPPLVGSARPPPTGASHMTRCKEGHFYDSSANSDCPFCGVRDFENTGAFSDEPYPQTERDKVEFNAFAPASSHPGTDVVVDVWAHLTSDYDKVAQVAQRTGRSSNVGHKRGIRVRRGTEIDFLLSIPSVTPHVALDRIYWDGEPVNASFAVSVPADCAVGDHAGTATMLRAGIPFAKLVFSIRIGSEPDSFVADRSQSLDRPKSAFASYASADRLDVLKRVQGVLAIAPDLDIFLDVLSLRAGQRWHEKLVEHVSNKDIFLLFWSVEASQSKWVAAEWRMALTKRGLDYIHPVPLADALTAPPPEELTNLHFSDPIINFISASSSRIEPNARP